MLLVVSAVAFALLSAAGGDALTGMIDNPQVSSATIERLRSSYGLDRPVIVRYGSWLAGVARGDLGESFFFKVPVGGLILSRLWNTAQLSLFALLFAIVISGVLAFCSVRYRSTWLRKLNELIILFTASSPRIVLSLIALLIIVKISGGAFNFLPGSWGLLLVLSVVLSVPLVAVFLAQMQSELVSAMKEPFVVFARAKGLSEGAVIVRHAARAALGPVTSILGLSFGSLVGGSVIVETVLGWQGVGALMVAAVRGRDVPLVMGILVVTSAAVWFGNTAAEFLQLLNDKRLREAELG